MAQREQQMILLVEDNAISRDALADILREEGYGVMEAPDGNEALTLLDTRGFDLIISDVLMPNLNGFDLLARIRLRWPNLPVILTSASMSQAQAKAILDGAAEFIEKPIDLSALFATVQRLLPTAGTMEAVDVPGRSEAA